MYKQSRVLPDPGASPAEFFGLDREAKPDRKLIGGLNAAAWEMKTCLHPGLMAGTLKTQIELHDRATAL